MVNYSSWKFTKDVAVTDLQLDKLNPRIPVDLSEASQNDIITIMVERYNILPLAESISKNGFEPREQMIVVWENHRPVVIEGNRRLTALKLLINPMLAPIKERSKYQALHDQIEMSLISNPYVLIAPDRASADPIVLNKHTTNTEIPWKPLLQSFFYERKVEEYSELNLDQIANKLNVSRELIDNALLRLDLYKRLLRLVVDDVKAYVEDPEKFDITTIERFINNSTIRKLIKVTVLDNKYVPADLAYFEFVIKCLTEWMYKGPAGSKLDKITSRTANTVEQMKKYITEAKTRYLTRGNEESLEESDVDIQESLYPTSDDEASLDSEPSFPSSLENNTTSTAHPAKKKTRRMLVEEDQFSYTVKGKANAKLLAELMYIQIDKTPSISAIIFRVFFERIVRQFLSNHKIRFINKGGNEKIRIGDAQFGEIIDFLTTRQCELIDDDDVKKSLKAFKGRDATKPNSLCNLNNIVHYQGKLYSRSEVRELVDSLESTIDYFLTNPEPKVIIAPLDDEDEESSGSGDVTDGRTDFME